MAGGIYAMHADRVADAMKCAAKKAGKNPDSITALDAYKRFGLQINGQMQNGALNQNETTSFDLNDKSAIREFANNLAYEDIPSIETDENTIKKITSVSKQDIFAWAQEKVKSLVGKSFTDPLGNKLFFKPGNDETLQTYSLHMVAGMGKNVDHVHVRRALALELASKTLEDPIAIVTQPHRNENGEVDETKPGRRMYLSLFKTDYFHAGNIVVGVEEGQSGRVITSFAASSDKRHKKAALKNIQNILKTAYSVDYIRLGLSGYSRPAVRKDDSQENTLLHTSGNSSISDGQEIDKQNLVHNFNILSVNMSDVKGKYNQMAGENAQTAALDKLDQAKQMDSEGKSKEEVYKATGWLKGADGKWRFEIPDNLKTLPAEKCKGIGFVARFRKQSKNIEAAR